MTADPHVPRAPQRAFWVLTAVAVLAAGSLSTALRAPAGPLTGLRVALSGLVLIAATALAGRVLILLDRASRPPSEVDRHRRRTAPLPPGELPEHP